MATKQIPEKRVSDFTWEVESRTSVRTQTLQAHDAEVYELLYVVVCSWKKAKDAKCEREDVKDCQQHL